MEVAWFLESLPPEWKILLILGLTWLGACVLLGLVILLLHLKSRQGRIKERLGKAWRRFKRYELDGGSWWVKFIKNTKLPGLKDAVRPGIHAVKRISWLFMTSSLFGFGIFWIVFLVIKILGNPTTLTHHEEKVDMKMIPFPSVTIGLGHNFKKDLQDEINDLADSVGSTTDINGNAWSESEFKMLKLLAFQMCNPLPFELKWESTWNRRDIQIGEPLDSRTRSFLSGPLIEKSSELLNKFRPKCSQVMKLCSWGGQNVSCSDAFSDTHNEVGLGCGFNKLPERSRVLRKRPSIHARIINESFCEEEKEHWNKFNIDEELIWKEPVPRNKSCRERKRSFQEKTPLTQPSGGQQFGLSFVAEFDPSEKKCPQFENGLAVVLDIHTLWDDSNTLRNGLLLPLNHDIAITLEPMIIVSEQDIRPFGPIRRKCSFYKEAEQRILAHYNFYSEENCIQECIANATVDEVKCGLISQPMEEGQRICSTEKELADARKIQQSASVSCSACLPGCTEVKYKITAITKIPYTWDTAPTPIKLATSPNRSSIRVSIAFKERNAIVIKRKLTYDWSEVLGLIGGTLNLTNGLSFIDIGRFTDALHILLAQHGAAMVAALTAFFTGIWAGLCRRKREVEAETEGHAASTDSGVVAEIAGPDAEETNDDSDNPEGTHSGDDDDDAPGVGVTLWGKVRRLLPSISFLVHQAERREEGREEDPEIGIRMRRGRVRPATTPTPTTPNSLQLPAYFSPPTGERERRAHQFPLPPPPLSLFLVESETQFWEEIDEDED